MTKTIDQFFIDYENKLINDGGTQCVAVSNRYNSEVVQGGWIGTPLTGYAIDWWTNFGNDSDYNNYVKVDKNAPAQKGDIAIWNKYPSSGLPHIAVVKSDLGGSINCLTQNPGKAHFENLVKTGLAGYLRPKKFVKVVVASAGIPAPAAPSQGTVHLPGSVNSWRLYHEGGPYIRGSEKASLNPQQYGGLSYAIVARPAPNVVVIQTQMFGRGAIYVGPDTPARFS